MTTEEKIIKNKLELIKLATTLPNVSQACKVMGYSRDSFYRFKELYDKGGELALQEISRKKPCLKIRVEEHVEKVVVDFAIGKPAYGQVRTSNELKRKGQILLNATQDPEAVDIALAAKAMAHEFEKTLIIGRTSVDSDNLQFKGLLRMLAELESTSTTDLDATNNDMVIAGAADSDGLGMPDMDALIDLIKPGKPDMLLMSRRARRKLNALSRASASIQSKLKYTRYYRDFWS